MNENKEIKQATILVTVLLYTGVIIAALYPQSQAIFVRVFGAVPFGIPCRWFVIGLLAVVLAPVPLVFWHLGVVFSRRQQDATGMCRYSRLLWVLYGAWQQRDIRLSYAISIIGQVYFILVVAAWIWYATSHGL
jgi:hypothetical protein